MPLNLEQKKRIVDEVKKVADSALSAVVAEYPGLRVAEMNELRSKARKSGVYVRVVPNTLAKRALSETGFSCLNDALVGPLVLMLSINEPGAAARLVKDFIKDHENLKVKALALGGKLFAAKELDAIASLPSRDEAIAIFMSVLKAPITKFVRTLAEPHAKLVRTLAAVGNAQQEAA